MSDEIIKVLDDLSQRLGIAVDWTSPNMLPYLQMLTRKIVNYRLAMSGASLATGILMLVAAVKLAKVAEKQCHKGMEDKTDWLKDNWYVCSAALCCVGTAFAGLIGFINVRDAIAEILTCMTFPEKIILDQLLQVLKNQ